MGTICKHCLDQLRDLMLSQGDPSGLLQVPWAPPPAVLVNTKLLELRADTRKAEALTKALDMARETGDLVALAEAREKAAKHLAARETKAPRVLVTIPFSEAMMGNMEEPLAEKVGLKEADHVLHQLRAGSPNTGGYSKTDFLIEFPDMAERWETYKGRIDLYGLEREAPEPQTLLEHIKAFWKYYQDQLSDEDKADRGEMVKYLEDAYAAEPEFDPFTAGLAAEDVVEMRRAREKIEARREAHEREEREREEAARERKRELAARDIADIAKDVRRDIKEALRTGLLPKGLKTSVRVERYSMGQSLHVRVKRAPFQVVTDEWKAFWGDPEARRSADPECERYTTEAKRVLKVLKDIWNTYNYDNSDPMSDYYDYNYGGGAGYDLEEGE